MANNVAIQVYRGLRANLAALASTGKAGVLAWTTDSNEFFVDSGTGTGIGTAWLPIANDIAVFTAVSQAAMIALAAKVGDLCTRTDNNLTYILTAFPASTAGNWTPIAVTSGVTIQGLVAGTAHEWVSYIDNSGVQHLTQPAFSDISGQLAQTQLPTTIGAGSSLTDIDCGTF
jgi:hypothetical protein